VKCCSVGGSMKFYGMERNGEKPKKIYQEVPNMPLL